MSTKYKATIPDTGYFVTITILGCCGHGLQIRAMGQIPVLRNSQRKVKRLFVRKTYTTSCKLAGAGIIIFNEIILARNNWGITCC